MKIAIISMYYGSNYGQGLCVQKIAEELSKKNKVFVFHSQKEHLNNKKNLFFHFINAGKIVGMDFIKFKKKIEKEFKKINEKEKFDLIYANSFEGAGLINQNLPFFYHARGTVKGNALQRPESFFLAEILRKPFIKWFEKWDKQCCKKASKIFVPSRQIEKEIIEYYKIEKNKIQKINDGIDLKQFNPRISGKKIRKQFVLKKNKIILFAGRIVPQKGLQYLIEAMPQICKKIPEAKLLVVGDTTSENYLNQIKKRINKLKLNNFVVFSGHAAQKQMPQFLAAADLVVSPSTYEPFGIINLEAAALHKKLLMSELIGTKELFKNYAEFFNPYCVEETAEKIVKELNSNKKTNIPEAEKICTQCTWQFTSMQIQKTFQEELQ